VFLAQYKTKFKGRTAVLLLRLASPQVKSF
jgi:hypothetical protein